MVRMTDEDAGQFLSARCGGYDVHFTYNPTELTKKTQETDFVAVTTSICPAGWNAADDGHSDVL